GRPRLQRHPRADPPDREPHAEEARGAARGAAFAGRFVGTRAPASTRVLDGREIVAVLWQFAAVFVRYIPYGGGMERKRDPRGQGDLGERSAMLWFGAKGAAVFMPCFHSPDFDLVADWR